MFSIQFDLMEQSINGIRTLVNRVQLIKFEQGGGGLKDTQNISTSLLDAPLNECLHQTSPMADS